MTELTLYKFINEKAKQCSWIEDELILWLDPNDIEEFALLIDRCSADDGGYPMLLQRDGTICIVLNDLLEEYNIYPEDVIDREY